MSLQTWQTQGVWERVFAALVASTAVSAASSGAGRRWTVARALRPWAAARRARTRRTVPSWVCKIHLLVDQRGTPLAIDISGANQHDKWSVHNLVVHVAVKRPTSQQHFCGDKGYDFDDVRQTVAQAGYVPHIKRKRRRGEPLADDHPSPARRNIRTPLGSRADLWLAGQTA